MEQIADNVFLESGYPGVVLAAFNFQRGLVLMDAPFRPEDQRSWRTTLLGLNSGGERLLVMMDTHIDRTIGIKSLDASVIGHEQSLEVLRGRSTNGRAHEINAGSDWEPFELPANIRWVDPDLTFAKDLKLYWDESPIRLTYQPGVHFAATWLWYEVEKLLFVGDTVVLKQPPFLAFSNLETWLDELVLLQSDFFKGYKIISGRNGFVRKKSISELVDFLSEVKIVVDQMKSSSNYREVAQSEIPNLLKHFHFNKGLRALYENRLNYGLEKYYQRHFMQSEQTNQGEE